MSEHVQDPVEGRLEVPRRRVLREPRGWDLYLYAVGVSVPFGSFTVTPGDQRRALHRPLHPLRDVPLPGLSGSREPPGPRGRGDVTEVERLGVQPRFHRLGRKRSLLALPNWAGLAIWRFDTRHNCNLFLPLASSSPKGDNDD
jgi:hypothetical protein